MSHDDVAGHDWDPAELEDATCFRCGTAGSPVHHLPPFGVRRCQQCGLVFVSPRLSERGRQALYDDERYFEGDHSVYGSQDGGGMARRLQRLWATGRLDLVTRRLDAPVASARLLEVGCAYGLFLSHAQARGFEVAGQEVSAPAAAKARQQLGVDVHEGPLDDLAADATFDVVCAWDVIEHVPDPAAFLASARRLVRPGGLVVLSCPYVTSLPARLLGSRWWTLKPWEHIWHFSPATLRGTAIDAGLGVRSLRVSPLRRSNLARLDSMVAVLARA